MAVQGQELDLMLLVGSFQLSLFFDAVIFFLFSINMEITLLKPGVGRNLSWHLVKQMELVHAGVGPREWLKPHTPESSWAKEWRIV